MFRAPTAAGLPPFSFLLHDLPASPHQGARHLGLTTRTTKHWLKAEQAPRPVMLALFWESRWGRSAADTEAANYGAVYYRLAMGLQLENEVLRLQIQQLQDLETMGAANGPVYAPGLMQRPKSWPPPRGF